MKKQIEIGLVENLIRKSEGKIFGVDFVKLDGTRRHMTARLGVKKHLRGGVNTTAHIKKYITAYDMVNLGYRTINLETITHLQVNGDEYTVV